jgi:uncharacterized protein YndB with AHSA1/START domain
MSKSIRKEAVYPHPPEKVWVALTDRRALAEWLMPNDFSPVVGHRFRFQVDPMPACDSIVLCEVLHVDPPRKLVWSWIPENPRLRESGAKPSTVTWTLESTNGGTRLILLHEGLEIYPWWQRFMLRFGWRTMVKSWIGRCAVRVDEAGQFNPGAFPIEKRCYKAKTIPAELTR